MAEEHAKSSNESSEASDLALRPDVVETSEVSLNRTTNQLALQSHQLVLQSQKRIRARLLTELAELESSDQDFKPTKYASTTAKNLIDELFRVPLLFPVPSILPDGDGGILLDWNRGTRMARLIIPDSPGRQGYLYHEDDQGYAAEYDLSNESIKTRLRWLTRDEQ